MTIIDEAIGNLNELFKVRDVDGKYNYYICLDCYQKMTKAKIPSMSNKNNLELFNINDNEELKLTEMENALVATNILFQMFVQLPNSRWTGTKKQIVSIPIYEEDIENTISQLPRTPEQASLCKAELKRRKGMKNSHMKQYISVSKIIKALKKFQELDNKHYQNLQISTDYEELVRLKDPDGFSLIFPEEERSSESNNCEEDEIEELENNIEMEDDDEEEQYNREDPVQKWKFSHEEKSTFIEEYPEMRAEVTQPTNVNNDDPNMTVKVAPGEGKCPVNILKTKDWDTSSFPNLHPDGKNGLDEPRYVKLSAPDYFQQRILNFDRRFANSTEFVFAANAYLELRRFDSNINISFMRGKKNADGQYSLNDAYSVFENAPGTPRYWQKRRYELLSKIENIGPFQLFFTLSCAEKRWSENFTTFLQDHDITYVVKNSKESCYIDGIPLEEFLQKEENMTTHEYIRQNILTTTLNFNNRVQEFIKNIVMNKDSPLAVSYYNYRVEFQRRGEKFCFLYYIYPYNIVIDLQRLNSR